MNPYVMGGAVGLNALMQLFAPETPEQKMAKWRMGKQPELYNQFQGQLKNQGDVINPARMMSLMSLFRQAQRPTQNAIAGGAAKFSGMQSPETWSMINRNAAAPEAAYAGQLGEMNVQMTEQAKQNLMRLLAGMVG